MKNTHGRIVLSLLTIVSYSAIAEAPAPVPDWALPGSATHQQVSPPTDFHRAARTLNEPIGVFDAQSDVGAAVLLGHSSYDAATGKYTIVSAGYNIWYVRDEFRFLWKKMQGDVSLAADINFPDSQGYGDRKAVLMIRQSLDDDSSEVFAALHGAGMIQLAWRAEKGQRIKDTEYRIGSRGALPGGTSPDDLVIANAKRIGIEKHGDSFALYVSMNGEPMHQFGSSIQLHVDSPFYVGIGFCSHIPDKVDTAVMSNLSLTNTSTLRN